LYAVAVVLIHAYPIVETVGHVPAWLKVSTEGGVAVVALIAIGARAGVRCNARAQIIAGVNSLPVNLVAYHPVAIAVLRNVRVIHADVSAGFKPVDRPHASRISKPRVIMPVSLNPIAYVA
jgi:hypothetical protein